VIGTNLDWRRKTIRTGRADQIILIYAVATDADGADQHTVFI
jgi:hypothetical protein